MFTSSNNFITVYEMIQVMITIAVVEEATESWGWGTYVAKLK